MYFKFRGRHLGFFTSGFFALGRTTTMLLFPLDSRIPKHRYNRWNFAALLCTSWDIRFSSLKAAILDFPLPVSSRLVVQHCYYSQWIAGSRKHRYSRRNFVAIMCISWDIRISSLEAAILDFPLPVSSRLVIQHSDYFQWIAGPQKHKYSRWNFAAILCPSWDIRISSFEAAILNFWLPLTYLLLTIISITPLECPYPKIWV